MEKSLHQTVGRIGERLIRLNSKLFIITATLLPMSLQASAKQLNWSGGNSDIEGWFNTILLVIMGVFVMTACIMGSLAFKQLAADGNWKDFWSKIAGAIGMFVVPIAIYWVKDQK